MLNVRSFTKTRSPREILCLLVNYCLVCSNVERLQFSLSIRSINVDSIKASGHSIQYPIFGRSMQWAASLHWIRSGPIFLIGVDPIISGFVVLLKLLRSGQIKRLGNLLLGHYLNSCFMNIP
jgi:hypothetical protein